jgi:hypothetical protein
MQLSRSIETTVMGFGRHGDDEQPISFLFLPATLPRDVGIKHVLHRLRIAPVEFLFGSGDDRAPRLDDDHLDNAHVGLLGALLLGQPFIEDLGPLPDSVLDGWINGDAVARSEATQLLQTIGYRALHQGLVKYAIDEQDLQAVRQILHEPIIVVESSPPHLADFASLVRTSSGAAVGAYVGYAAGQNAPLLLLLTVPFGILICASAMGVGRALEQGLRAKVHELLVSPDAGGSGIIRPSVALPPAESSDRAVQC